MFCYRQDTSFRLGRNDGYEKNASGPLPCFGRGDIWQKMQGSFGQVAVNECLWNFVVCEIIAKHTLEQECKKSRSHQDRCCNRRTLLGIVCILVDIPPD